MDLARASESDFHGWVGAGDLRRAGEWLVLRYADEVLGLCGAMIRDRQAAEDLTQDVFQRAFAALAAFRGDASTRTWLLQIARNRCIDHLRARRKDPWGGAADDGEPDAQPDEAPLPHDLILRRNDVEDALSRLSEGERALVVLRFKNGLEYAELAEAFGLREGTVRMRISRALAKMRELLEAREAREAEDVTAPFAASPPFRAVPQRAAMRAPGSAPPPPARAAAPRQRAQPGAPPPLPSAEPRPAPPAARAPSPPRDEPVTRAGTAKPGFVGRMLAALWGGDRRAARRMPPDHPLSRYFLDTLDGDDDRVVERLVDRARSL